MLIKTKAKSALKMLITLIFSLVLCTSGLLLIQKPTQVSASGQVSINTSLDSNQQSEKTPNNSTNESTLDNERISSVSTNGNTSDNEETTENSINKNLPVSKATAGSSAVLKSYWRNEIYSSTSPVTRANVTSIRITTDSSKITDFTQGTNVKDDTSENDLYYYYKEAGYQVNTNYNSSSNNAVYSDGYDIVIYANVETIYAPENSRSLFGHNSETIVNNDYDSFVNCKSIIFENFDTSKVTDMRYMFCCSKSLTSLDVSNFDTSNVTDMSDMFYYCSSLTSLDVSNFDTSKVTSMGSMFSGLKLTSLDVSNFNTSKVTDMSGMFLSCSSLISLNVSNFDTSNVTDMISMFSGCSKLTGLNVSNFDTSNVKNMGHMFLSCSSLTSLDVSNFDTSKVTNMWYMFYNCSSLTSLDVNGFNMNYAACVSTFEKCTSLESLNLSNFKAPANMSSMFSGLSALTSINLSNADTSNVTNMGFMFQNCSSLTSLNLSNFDTSKVTYMSSMFSGCSKLTSLDVTNFNTSNVTSMSQMFQNCSSLTSLDLSNFDFEKVTSAYSMLSNCTALQKIIAPTNLNGLSINLPCIYQYTDSDGSTKTTTTLVAGKTHYFLSKLPATLSENWLAGVTSVSPSEISSIKFTSNSSAISGYIKGENVADSSSAEDLYYYYKSNGSGLYDIVVYSDVTICAPANSELLFVNLDTMEGISNCTSLIFDNFNTSNVTNMMGMFCGCSSVKNLDISGFSFESIDPTNEDALMGMLGMSDAQFGGMLGLEGDDLENYVNLSFEEKVAFLSSAGMGSEEEIQMFLGLYIFSLPKIIAPTTIPSSLTIALPDTYNYSDPSGNTISTEVLVAGATHISPNASSTDTNETGVVSDSILLSLIALCFVFSGFVLLKRKKVR